MRDLMTSSRKVRTTKVRVCAYFALILLVCALAALYANSRLQYEEIQKSYHLCKQEKENLSTQLQVIFDYKQRLDKSLKTEKADHQRTKSELEGKLNEEKLKYEKIINEEKLRFAALQQQHNILQTHKDDLKEECSKTQKDQLDEINALQAQLKEVQEEVKKSENEKDNAIAHFKTQIEVLHNEVDQLKGQLKKPIEKNYTRTENSTVHFSKLLPNGESQYVLDKNPEHKSVLVIPRGAVPVLKSSSPHGNINFEGINNLGPFPITSSSTTKRSTSKESRLNPALPRGIDMPEKSGNDDFSNNRYSNIGAPMESKESNKKINNDAMEDDANDIIDLPNKANADEDDDPDDGNPVPNGELAERN